MSHKKIFESWLDKTQSHLTKPEKYSNTVTTISNHLKKLNIDDHNLYNVDSQWSAKKLYRIYFSTPALFEKNERGNRMYSRAFDLYLEFLEDIFETETTLNELAKEEKIDYGVEKNTEKESIILSRVGQGLFRKNLIEYWGKCSVTGISDLKFLIASHIKPWRNSNNQEKLDKYNGLLLTPNIDKAFDIGLISFESSGKIIISTLFDDYKNLGINHEMNISIHTNHKPYLKYHREIIFNA